MYRTPYSVRTVVLYCTNRHSPPLFSFLFWRLALAQLLITVHTEYSVVCTYRRYLGYHKDCLVPLPPGVVAGNKPVITQPNGLSHSAHTHSLLAPSPSEFAAQTLSLDSRINFPLARSLTLSPAPTSPHLILPHHPSSFCFSLLDPKVSENPSNLLNLSIFRRAFH